MTDFQHLPSSAYSVATDPVAPTNSLVPAPSDTYDGGFSSARETGVLLRIGNGGAGQIGLIAALANAFIQDWAAKGNNPFQVEWYLGDTTETLNLLAGGVIDIAITYNVAAEGVALDTGIATKSVYAFRDHFLLVGPPANPANLLESDGVSTMFSKIAASGNRDVAIPPNRLPTRFLSRFDKSATNIKESQLFLTVGQVPWAQPYSTWYKQYPEFPLKALATAAELSDYTLSDLSTWTTSPDSVKAKLRIFKSGSDEDPKDPLLNPAHALSGARASPAHAVIGQAFMDWLIEPDGGQKVIRTFSMNGQVVVTEAP